MKESEIQKQIRIKASELGCVPIRLNSGKAWQGELVGGVLVHPRAVELCPEGTSDLVLICPGGVTIWMENKTLKGKQRESQKRFEDMIRKMEHIYEVARSPEEAEKIIKKYKKI